MRSRTYVVRDEIVRSPSREIGIEAGVVNLEPDITLYTAGESDEPEIMKEKRQ